jgi:hypothetical protein
MAAEHHGTVTANGLPVPGAQVTATKGDKKVATTTDDKGFYRFPNLEDGIWKIDVEMLGFAPQSKELGVMAEAPSPQWELKLQTLDQLRAALAPKPAAAAAPANSETATVAKPTEAPKPADTAKPAATQSAGAAPQRNGQQGGGRGPGNGRPSVFGGQQGQGRGGFQRLDVNQSGDLAAAGNEGGLSSETAADLSQSASDSLLVNGSVSSGIGMPQGPPDWAGGRGGMDGFGGGPGGMGMGMMGPNGDGVNADGAAQAMGGRGGRGGGPGGGGPGGFMGGGGPGGFGGRGGPGGFGGRGGRGGEGRGPGGGRPGMASFGNARRDRRMQYNGNLAFNLDNSVWDAQSFSVTGNHVPKPSYDKARATVMLGGPLKIPHLLSGQHGMFTINYQLSRSRNANTNVYTVPTLAERSGDFSQAYTTGPVTIFDPTNNQPFPNNTIPQNRLNPIALKLANYYPLPNFPGYTRNYSTSIVSIANSDNINARLNQTLNTKNRLSGGVGYQGSNGQTPNLFNFIDTRNMSGINANVQFTHNFTTRIINNLNYRYSRSRTLSSPYFSNRTDIEGQLGITGVSTLPVNWGPPSLSFTNGISGLSDGAASLARAQTSAVGDSLIWIHGTHNMTFGGDFSRRQINPLSDSNARGGFTFTGSSTSQLVNGIAVQGTGFDFADFLLGTPATSSVDFGNPDKYFRASAYDVYVNDDWRINTKFSLNGGLRWDYQTPINELYNRIVNLDIAPGFGAVTPVLPGQTGSLTGLSYSNTLMHPQKHNFSPRIGFAWRPFPKHSTRITGGYGLYYNTSVYNTIANNLAAQPPFATNLSIANSVANPLTLLNPQGTIPSANSVNYTNTRAIDPFYRIGYAQIWQFALQNDLGHSLVGTLTFNHTKGTHLDQDFLPNSLPPGSKATAFGPAGYIYEVSNGDSTFNSATAQLQRRFRNGISGNISYMFSKAMDDGGVGTLIAQNWLDLTAERALSNFDARHTVNAQWQYSSGQGTRGGGLVNGWKGTLLKGWTFQQGITLRTGSPLTISAGGNRSVVSGTGITGPVRADATGAPLFLDTGGYGFNIHAFSQPIAGQWGTAGRNTIPGPTIFALNGSMNRNFRIGERRSIDLQFQVNNALNHVTITSWGTTLNSATFGLPTAASAMRSMTAQLRFRF